MTDEAPVSTSNDELETDPEMKRIVEEEEKVLARVERTLTNDRPHLRGTLIDYDAELLALRDQLRDARMEDIPPIIEEMERLQQVAKRRAEVTLGAVDVNAPYFGRLVLSENDKKREVLIGRATFVDPKTGIRIVDWRDAPISRVFYRYEEGDPYEEAFGDRDVEGEVIIRRSLAIQTARLRRVQSPQGTFVKSRAGGWKRLAPNATRLTGGQGAAMRPEGHHKPGRLGTGEGDVREDKHLSEITALIDARQFELISRPTTGLVVIQGGAGSGKTTIGLHRMAYLAFQEPKRYRPDKMLVLVFNDALVRYIGRVLPALGVEGVKVITYDDWSEKLRQTIFTNLPIRTTDDTPTNVQRFKKHPALLRLLQRTVAERTGSIDAEIVDLGATLEMGGKALRQWEQSAGHAPGVRLRAMRNWLSDSHSDGKKLPADTRHRLERLLDRHLKRCTDVAGAWSEMLTNRGLIGDVFAQHAEGVFSEAELDAIHAYCSRRCPAATSYREDKNEIVQRRQEEDEEGGGADDEDDDETIRPIDGVDEIEERARIDREDDAILLRLHQMLDGPLSLGRGKDVIQYEHIFVDETQDLSPVELAVIVDTASERRSITLAGDVAQKIYLDNGFTDWKTVLTELGLATTEIEPLRLTYRSTHEILEFATEVLGPLRNQVEGNATRHGAPVELFDFVDSGEAVGFLSEALRSLVREEPLASVAVIARHPEQADLYYKGLVSGEVPNLRRIADQDFAFRPGVEVTDIRQVKGLEFDYVILVDVNTSSYPTDVEARHLLHIGATRAAHQLWVVTTSTASKLLPESLRSNEL